ncbi:hypothetical protein CLIM01_06201 [Colletotrichum limetticola]|uniref:Uncharacterized protein n=1 Tax=Colletotrichum limetticola TaxID=1209924 RepID=A0ABQ9PY12_9PEZI|nr:hypothetical protein CLIM01_06201 [Colletotrichum limetticola]
MGERTGSRVFQWVWSYVIISRCQVDHIPIRALAIFQPIAGLIPVHHN